MSSGILDFILIPIRNRLFWIPVYLFLLSYIFLNFSQKRWFIFLAIAACIFCSDTTSSKLIKKSVKRARPCNTEQIDVIPRIHCSQGFSFTSSHATNHFAISIFLFLLFASFKYRFIFLIWAGMISLAQVYVGVHFPLDVMAGAVLGSLIGWAVYKLFDKIFNFKFIKLSENEIPAA